MAGKIKFLDLKKQYKSIKKEIDRSVQRILSRGDFIGGKEVERFERQVAEFCRTKYAVSVNSCTDALFLSLKALGIKEGDEVITSPFTFIATAEAIANLGVRPVFADIKRETFNINPEEIRKKITKKTKAILPVHLFGQAADMSNIVRIAKKYKLYVVEDAAQAFGAEHKGRKAGSIGDIGCFSFFPSKNLGAYGDGGMAITNNKRLSEKITFLKNHGSSPEEKYLNLISGTNSRLDTIQAAILRVKLKYINKWNKKRQKIAEYYGRNLEGIGGIVVPKTARLQNHVFHQYTIRTKMRDRLKIYLKQFGIETMVYYPFPLHLQPAFGYLGYKKGDFPEAESVANEVLSLPIYPELIAKEQDFVIKKIIEFYSAH